MYSMCTNLLRYLKSLIIINGLLFRAVQCECKSKSDYSVEIMIAIAVTSGTLLSLIIIFLLLLALRHYWIINRRKRHENRVDFQKKIQAIVEEVVQNISVTNEEEKADKSTSKAMSKRSLPSVPSGQQKSLDRQPKIIMM